MTVVLQPFSSYLVGGSLVAKVNQFDGSFVFRSTECNAASMFSLQIKGFSDQHSFRLQSYPWPSVISLPEFEHERQVVDTGAVAVVKLLSLRSLASLVLGTPSFCFIVTLTVCCHKRFCLTERQILVWACNRYISYQYFTILASHFSA